jgi:hypothetical protein
MSGSTFARQSAAELPFGIPVEIEWEVEIKT